MLRSQYTTARDGGSVLLGVGVCLRGIHLCESKKLGFESEIRLGHPNRVGLLTAAFQGRESVG